MASNAAHSVAQAVSCQDVERCTISWEWNLSVAYVLPPFFVPPPIFSGTTSNEGTCAALLVDIVASHSKHL